MSGGPLKSIGRVLFWRYARGSWQYDILCGLILVFIFATPKSVFDGSYFRDRLGKLQLQKVSEVQETSNNSEKKSDDNQPSD
jgi:hypothetical protein